MILLLKRGYLDVDYFQNKFEVDITQQWSSQFQQHSEDGMLTIEGGRSSSGSAGRVDQYGGDRAGEGG